MKTGIQLIEEERARQVSTEGWTATRDDAHQAGEMPMAGALYARLASGQAMGFMGSAGTPLPPPGWPWEAEWWKPSRDPVQNLIKAGALIAAEIDRLQRAGQAAA